MNSRGDFAFLEVTDAISVRPCTWESSVCCEAGLLEGKGTCQAKDICFALWHTSALQESQSSSERSLPSRVLKLPVSLPGVLH